MPRILVAARADQGRPNRLEFLQARRIAGHRSGFGFSALRTVGKAIARQRGHCRIARVATRVSDRPWGRARASTRPFGIYPAEDAQ